MMFVGGVPKKFLLRLLAVVFLLVGLDPGGRALRPASMADKTGGLSEAPAPRLLRSRLCARIENRSREAEGAGQQRNDSYNVEQALISVGSGGFFGKGWKQGTQNALGYLPRAVAHNDFIFSVIAEEKGFMGSVIVITLYSMVLFTGIRIAGQTRDRLGKLLAVGVVTCFSAMSSLISA